MKYQFVPMNELYSSEIVDKWHYEGIYSFYDMAADKQDLEIFLDRKYWKDVIFAVLDENSRLIGWVSFYFEGEVLWLSLGLKPELTGAGLGEQYVLDCIHFAKSHFKLDNQALKLDVAWFNQRAIKVYERAGFRKTGRNIKNTQIGKVKFLQMTMIIEEQEEQKPNHCN